MLTTMARADQPTSKRRPRAGSVSWLALVAATSLGIRHAETVRAEVKLAGASLAGGGRYRLIVQSYDRLATASFIPASSRPRGSVQRSVTADDLARGIRIDLIELGSDQTAGSKSGVVVAWVEPGEANLEFDARRARPTPGSLYGIAASDRLDDESTVEIVIDRRLREV
jgi:hypothetical protein